MPKAFSKNLAQLALIALAISSVPALAGYNDDSDCAAVSNGARSGAQRTTDMIDNAAKTTGAAVEQAKACVDTLVAAGKRSISDFGGGVQIPDAIRTKLALQGCKVLSAAQTKIVAEVRQAGADAASQLPAAVQGTAGGIVNNGLNQAQTQSTAAVQNQIGQQNNSVGVSPPVAPTSVFQRLANIF